MIEFFAYLITLCVTDPWFMLGFFGLSLVGVVFINGAATGKQDRP